MRLLILGGGGHGRSVADAALASSDFSAVAFLDNRLRTNVTPEGWPVIGGLDELEKLACAYDGVIIGLGDARKRLELAARVAGLGLPLVSVVHPGATISRYCSVGQGTVVLAGACINIGARIGASVIINTGATVDHDCDLAEGVHICPGANLAGSVSIGERTWFGIGAVARQGIRIGSDVMVGAGAVVVKDIASGSIVAGNPARNLAEL